jgi:hypothetical protein
MMQERECGTNIKNTPTTIRQTKTAQKRQQELNRNKKEK